MRTRFRTVLVAVVAPLALIGLAPAPNASAAPYICDNTATTPLVVDDPSLKVVVPEGASCYIEDSVIHSLRAHDPVNVSFLGSTLLHGAQHNIMIDGATGNVVIGNEGCRFDPYVGNNIKVTNSFNVLICQMAVDNNIMVTGNDGRITVRESVACNNVVVSRNLSYAGDATDHNNVDRIRLIDVLAARHVFTVDNADREVVRRNVQEFVMTPSACRRLIR